ncbi:hypothetical protein JTB14_030753 [Gonioctena quinquepunctata]|nr:hypothetical protein JTB14_030753 [Gonioctena quinquepunctata]
MNTECLAETKETNAPNWDVELSGIFLCRHVSCEYFFRARFKIVAEHIQKLFEQGGCKHLIQLNIDREYNGSQFGVGFLEPSYTDMKNRILRTKMGNYERKAEEGTTPSDLMLRAARKAKVDGLSVRKAANDFQIPHSILRRYCEKFSEEEVYPGNVMPQISV